MEDKAKSETSDERFWSDFNQALMNVPNNAHSPDVLFKSIQIDSQEMMERIANLFFETAISKPESCFWYGHVCRNFAERDSSTTNFRKSIIARCLSELENCSRNEKLRVTKTKEIEKCTDAEKKKELQVLYEKEGKSLRMKSVGTICLMKELWRRSLLKKKIMHFCINHLLQYRDEENLEFLYKLLMEIGEKLEFNGDLEKYYKQIQIRINDQGPEKISSSVRKMLQELIVLRENGWSPEYYDSPSKLIAALKRRKDKIPDSHEKALYAEIRCIVNTYDSKNIDIVASKIVSLPIKHENLLEVINIFIEKVCDDDYFSRPCVLLCKKLPNIEVPGTGVKNEIFKDFESFFVFECAYEFGQYVTAAKILKREKSSDPKELVKSMNYASLIGELFREGSFPRMIIEVEIKCMLENKTNENLDRLCALLDTIQEKLVHFENLPTYIEDLQQVLDERASGRFSDLRYENLEDTLDWIDLLLMVARREGIIIPVV